MKKGFSQSTGDLGGSGGRVPYNPPAPNPADPAAANPAPHYSDPAAAPAPDYPNTYAQPAAPAPDYPNTYAQPAAPAPDYPNTYAQPSAPAPDYPNTYAQPAAPAPEYSTPSAEPAVNAAYPSAPVMPTPEPAAEYPRTSAIPTPNPTADYLRTSTMLSPNPAADYLRTSTMPSPNPAADHLRTSTMPDSAPPSRPSEPRHYRTPAPPGYEEAKRTRKGFAKGLIIGIAATLVIVGALVACAFIFHWFGLGGSTAGSSAASGGIADVIPTTGGSTVSAALPNAKNCETEEFSETALGKYEIKAQIPKNFENTKSGKGSANDSWTFKKDDVTLTLRVYDKADGTSDFNSVTGFFDAVYSGMPKYSDYNNISEYFSATMQWYTDGNEYETSKQQSDQVAESGDKYVKFASDKNPREYRLDILGDNDVILNAKRDGSVYAIRVIDDSEYMKLLRAETKTENNSSDAWGNAEYALSVFN